MHKLLKGILAGCAVTAVLFGCNQPGAENAAPGTDTVIISQMQFQPAERWINRWDTVVFINQDMVGHDVTQLPARSWTSDTIQPGQSWKAVIGENTDYFCSIHPAMKGKVMVRN